jgi:hypothetical protein
MKLPPAPFPFLPRFQNGPRRQGCAPENLFKPRKRFSSAAHQTRALDRLRAVPKIFHREGKGGKCKDKTLSDPSSGRPPVAPPRAAQQVWSRQNIIGVLHAQLAIKARTRHSRPRLRNREPQPGLINAVAVGIGGLFRLRVEAGQQLAGERRSQLPGVKERAA